MNILSVIMLALTVGTLAHYTVDGEARADTGPHHHPHSGYSNIGSPYHGNLTRRGIEHGIRNDVRRHSCYYHGGTSCGTDVATLLWLASDETDKLPTLYNQGYSTGPVVEESQPEK